MRMTLGYTYDRAGLERDPQRVVRPDREAVRLAARRQVDRRDLALVGDVGDLVRAPQAHPHPIGPGGADRMRLGAGVLERELLDRPLVGDPPDLAGEQLGEPDRIVGRGDADRTAVARGRVAEREPAADIDPPDR